MSAEQMVRDLDELRAEARQYDDWMRGLRLGRGIEMIRFRFRAGVYGAGWLNEKKPEPMPSGMESEFYSFLSAKHSETCEAIREVEKNLAALEAAAEVDR